MNIFGRIRAWFGHKGAQPSSMDVRADLSELAAGWGAAFDVDLTHVQALAELNRERTKIAERAYRKLLPELLTGYGIPASQQPACIEFAIGKALAELEANPISVPNPRAILRELPQFEAVVFQRVRAELGQALGKPWIPGFGPIVQNEN